MQCVYIACLIVISQGHKLDQSGIQILSVHSLHVKSTFSSVIHHQQSLRYDESRSWMYCPDHFASPSWQDQPPGAVCRQTTGQNQELLSLLNCKPVFMLCIICGSALGHNMLFCEAASCYRALPENLSCIRGSRLMSFNADTDFSLLFEPAQQKKLQAWSQVTLIGWADQCNRLLMWRWTPSFLKRKLTKAGLVWIMDVSVF